MAGFESDTLSLQRSGWEISAAEDPQRGFMQIAMRHSKLQLRALSARLAWEYSQRSDYLQHVNVPIVQMEHVGQQIMVPGYTSVRDLKFRPIDATPSYLFEPPKTLDDLCHFATFEAKRILLPEDEVNELLSRVLELQEPARQKHFMEQAKDARLTLRANVMSFAA